MYPSQELSLLASRKRMLRRRISRQRYQCRELAEEVARPLLWAKPWLERLGNLWKLGKAVLGRSEPRSRGGWFSLLLKGLPMAFRMFAQSHRR